MVVHFFMLTLLLWCTWNLWNSCGGFERKVSSDLPRKFWNRACTNLVFFHLQRKPALLSASAFAFPSSSWLKLAKPVTLRWSWVMLVISFCCLGKGKKRKRKKKASSRKRNWGCLKVRKQRYTVYTWEMCLQTYFLENIRRLLQHLRVHTCFCCCCCFQNPHTQQIIEVWRILQYIY